MTRADHDVTGRAVVDDDREYRVFLATCEAGCLDSREVLSECSEGTLREVLPGTYAIGIRTLLVGSRPEKGLSDVAFDHVFCPLLRSQRRSALDDAFRGHLAVHLLASDADLDAAVDDLQGDFLLNGGDGIGPGDFLETTCGCFGGWRDLGFRLDGLVGFPEFTTEDESVFPFFGGHAAIASDEVCHLCQQAIRRDVQWYELEAAVWFMIEYDRAGLLRLSGVGSPDYDSGGPLDGDGITPRDQRAEGLRELTIETPDPGVLFLDPQERMTLVNRALKPRFAFRYFHLIFPFDLITELFQN